MTTSASPLPSGQRRTQKMLRITSKVIGSMSMSCWLMSFPSLQISMSMTSAPIALTWAWVRGGSTVQA